MHSDERKADVKPRVGFDLLNGNGIFEVLIRGGGKASSGLWLRNNADNFKASFFRSLSFKDKRTVKVFAALRGKKNALFVKVRVNSGKNFLSRFKRGAFSDCFADYLA